MLAACMVAALVTIAGAGAYLGAAVIARHRAQSAADLAALAGASALPDGQATACIRAQAVTTATGGQMVDCRIDGLDVVIVVADGRATAAARAGPAEP